MLLQRRDAREERGDHRSQLNDRGCLLGDRGCLLGNRGCLLSNPIVSPVARHAPLNACAAASWKELPDDEHEIDLTQCGMEHMDSPVNGYLRCSS